MSGFFLIDGVAHTASFAGEASPSDAVTAVIGDQIWVHLDGRIVDLTWQDALSHFAAVDQGGGADLVRAPMPGVVVSLSVANGDALQRGDTMMVIESMKLETVIRAPRDGEVETIAFEVGQSFERDAMLVALVPDDAA